MTRRRGAEVALGAALVLALDALSVGCDGDTPRFASDATVDAGPTEEGGPDAQERDEPPVLTGEERDLLATLAPAILPAPPPDVTNAVADDPRAALLGQRLFFDPSLSGALLDGDNDGSATTLGVVGETGKVSCAGCHVASAGFLDDRSLGQQISLGAGWVLRRTPSLLDVGHARLVMWDGSRDSLFAQVFGPLESRDEMNTSRLFVAERLYAGYRGAYEELFGPMPDLADASRFPVITADRTGCRKVGIGGFECHGVPGDAAEYDGMAAADRDAVTRVVVNYGKAIGAFERRLSCGAGRFDRWVNGDAAALSPSEQRGAQLFVGRGRCVTCHSGPLLTDQAFHNVGLKAERVAVTFIDADDPGAIAGVAKALADPVNSKSAYSDGDDGRLPAAVAPPMAGAFRTPGLRCGVRPSYMHTGQMKQLAEVVRFFDRGGDPFGYPGTNELAPLALGPRDLADLESFLRALDGPGPDASLRGPPP